MLKAFITRFVSNDSRIVLDEYSELRRMSQRSSDEENSRFNLLTRMSSY